MDEPKSDISAKLDGIADVAMQAEKKVEQKLTILWHEIESWQQDNQFIRSGYRPQSNSYLKSVRSWAYLHNETVNIFSHLFGAIAALVTGYLAYHSLKPRYDTADHEDVIVFGCFFLGAAACLGMSATYHTLANHSQSVGRFYNKLDYLGIVLLITGSFIPSIYYGFHRHPNLIRTYWTMITTIAVGCAAVSLSPFFAGSKWRPFRAGMFVAMGLSAIFPVIHGFRLYTLNDLENLIGLRWLVLQGALYVFGAALYAARIPERFKPGAFDTFGSSHQIFHILILLAAASHFVGLLKGFDTKHGSLAVQTVLTE